MDTAPIEFKVLSTSIELRKLRDLLREVFASSAPADDSNLDSLCESPAVCGIGAFSGDTVVGGLIAYELPLLNGTKEMYLYDIAVLPQYQKQGVGTGLMSTLSAEAKRRAVTTIFVEAEDDDEGAVAFYRSLSGEEIGVRHFNISVV